MMLIVSDLKEKSVKILCFQLSAKLGLFHFIRMKKLQYENPRIKNEELFEFKAINSGLKFRQG